jgi:hypothetical protein
MPEIAARTLCEGALEMLGVASAEQPIPAVMAQRALQTLNTMLDAWATERLLTYTRPKRSLTLEPSRQTYTWGVTTPAADIPGEPPVRLELATLLVDPTPPGLEWPVAVLTQTQYEAGVWQKTLQSTYVEMVYLEASQPVAVLHCWPVPDLSYTLHLFPWQASSPYESYDAVLPWPNGYHEAFEYNLALRLAPRYGVQVSPDLRQMAEESKRALYVPNAEVGRLSLTPGRSRGGTALGYPRGFLEGWR